MEMLLNVEIWLGFLTLTALELVLGIDNIIFISILVDKLPVERREFTRRLGLFLAMFMRIGLLLLLSWIVGLNQDLFEVFGKGFTGRDVILIAGGMFLLWKSTNEMHELIAHDEDKSDKKPKAVTFSAVIVQIVIIDIVFSLDSIITAVGMVDEVAVMIAAVVVSVGLMMVFAGPIGRFISNYPTIKTLALSFLLVIGVVLVADGFDHHVPKGYIYFALAFSLGVEALNIRLNKKRMALQKVQRPHAPATPKP